MAKFYFTPTNPNMVQSPKMMKGRALAASFTIVFCSLAGQDSSPLNFTPNIADPGCGRIGGGGVWFGRSWATDSYPFLGIYPGHWQVMRGR